jgi:hypothetical protein
LQQNTKSTLLQKQSIISVIGRDWNHFMLLQNPEKQVTLVAKTPFTLDWTSSKHHLLLLDGLCAENYRWTYTHIQKTV